MFIATTSTGTTPSDWMPSTLKKMPRLRQNAPSRATSCRWPLANSTWLTRQHPRPRVVGGRQQLLDRHRPPAVGVRLLGHHHQLGPGPLARLHPRVDVGRVLHVGRHDPVAGLEASPRATVLMPSLVFLTSATSPASAPTNVGRRLPAPAPGAATSRRPGTPRPRPRRRSGGWRRPPPAATARRRRGSGTSSGGGPGRRRRSRSAVRSAMAGAYTPASDNAARTSPCEERPWSDHCSARRPPPPWCAP